MIEELIKEKEKLAKSALQ